MTPPGSTNLSVLEHRVSVVESALETIAEAVKEIARNTTQIAQIEARHEETRNGLNRAFIEIDAINTEAKGVSSRITAVEIDMPGLREMRKYVVTAVVGIVSMVGVAVIGLVLLK